MQKDITVSLSETHPKSGKYSSATFFASEKFTVEINSADEYRAEYVKAFDRVQAMLDAQIELAGDEGRIVFIDDQERIPKN